MKAGKALFVFWLMYFSATHGHKCWAAAAPDQSAEMKKFQAGLDEQARILREKQALEKKADEARFKEKYGNNVLYGTLLEAPRNTATKNAAKKAPVSAPSTRKPARR